MQYINANWPQFFLTYGGMVAALLIIGVSALRGWLSFIPLATAVLLLLLYFLLASLWTAHQLYDETGVKPHHVLFDMGGLQSTDSFLYVDLGYRRRALELGRRLTTGRVVVVDVYNPQWAPSSALARWRARMPPPPPDPRYVWREGSINLIPLPDKSVTAVILCQVASEFWQRGDRLALLKEIHRVLSPDGRLLMAERVRNQTNFLLTGPGVFSLESAGQWRQLLIEAGFVVRREQDLGGVIHCFRADKPTPTEAQQLALQLAFAN